MNQTKSLSRVETARGLRLFLFEGAFSSLWGQLAGGVVFTGLALYLGANTTQIGILAALPALANLTQVIASFLSRRIANKERFVLITGSLHQCLWASAVLVPLWVPKELWVLAFGLVIGVASIFASLSSPAFNAWFAQLVPDNVRASYISRRSATVAFLGMLGGIGAGRFLDLVPGYRGFAILFGLALTFGLLGKAMLLRVPSTSAPRNLAEGQLSFREHLCLPMSNASFVTFCVFYFFWAFANGLAAPFHTVYLLKSIGAPYFQVASFTAISTLSTVISYRAWGYLVNRYGNTPIVQLTFLLSAPLSLFWFFATKGNYQIMITLVSVLGGVLGGGAALATNNMLYSLMPPGEEKANYWSFFSTVTGIAASSAPVLGGLLARLIVGVEFQLFGIPIGNLQLIFFLNGLLLLVPLLIFPRIGEKAASLPHVMRQLKSGNPLGLAYYLRQINQPVEEKTKVQAVRSLGKLKSPLAVDEIVKALDDASSEVRKEAARALGEIQDPGAVGPLLEKVGSPESGIQSEAALALGKIPDWRGEQALMEALDNPDRQVKISAISALGEVGGDEAKGKLLSLLQNCPDPALEPALIEALSKLGVVELIPLAYRSMVSFPSPVVQLQILSSIARVAGEAGDFYKLIALEEVEQTARALKLLRALKKRLDKGENTASVAEEMLENFERENYRGFFDNVRQLIAYSKRSGPAKDAILGFLEAEVQVPIFTSIVFILLLLDLLF